MSDISDKLKEIAHSKNLAIGGSSLAALAMGLGAGYVCMESLTYLEPLLKNHELLYNSLLIPELFALFSAALGATKATEIIIKKWNYDAWNKDIPYLMFIIAGTGSIWGYALAL